MMSDHGAEGASLRAEVVDLCTVTTAELDILWHDEERLWRERLLWDVSDTFAGLRRMQRRGALPGKAVRVEGRTVGYATYGIAGHLGVLLGFAVSPDWGSTGAGDMLLRETVEALRHKGVRRIESQFLSDECPWLPLACERQGFRTYWREVLRLPLSQVPEPVPPFTTASLETWRESDLVDAVGILQAAYDDGLEAEIYECYRSQDGCLMVLENILQQGSCGSLVPEASAVVRHRGRGIGFVLVTEVTPHHGHLPQVAVLPEYQGRGIGQWLLGYSLSRLVDRHFATLSLIVNQANYRARSIYQGMGWQTVLAYPVFTWENQTEPDNADPHEKVFANRP